MKIRVHFAGYYKYVSHRMIREKVEGSDANSNEDVAKVTVELHKVTIYLLLQHHMYITKRM
jgi:hypothetical protein